jgi:hypothetical protein
MISRRSVVLSSLAMAASSLASRLPGAAAQRRRARLTLHFTGGSVFKQIGERGVVAAQLTGKDKNGRYYVHPGGYEMPHTSYIVFPKGTVSGCGAFPANYQAKRLHVRFTTATDWQPICLLNKNISIATENPTPFKFKCDDLARYGDAELGSWSPIGNWADPNATTLGPQISSRFVFMAGQFNDAKAQNELAKDRFWKIGKGRWRTLSDAITMTLEADSITINGIHNQGIRVDPDSPLEGFVFAGPHAHMMGPEKYYAIEHAVLLNTIFDIPTGVDVRPRTDIGVRRPEYEGDLEHPAYLKDTCSCPLDRAPAVTRSPPDSDYCVNYDEFP